MTKRRCLLTVLPISLFLALISGCRREGVSLTAPVPSLTPSIARASPGVLVPTPGAPSVTGGRPTATVTNTPTAYVAVPTPSPAISATPPPATGPAVTAVQFALDVGENGELIFPASEFVYGVTLVYVRFTYRRFEEIERVTSTWYLNDNRVASGALEWDGGPAGDYILWLEDPNGLGRGAWRWELASDEQVLGTGALTIGGAPRYMNDDWAVSFDPPAGWDKVSETAEYVSFSSPDEREALALYVARDAPGLAEAAAASLSSFQAEHPDAQVVTSEDVTMNGHEALLQQVRYAGPEDSEQTLFLVTGVHDVSVYSLWVLGPSDREAALKTRLVAALYSIRFLAEG